jgi:hypothetical protein
MEKETILQKPGPYYNELQIMGRERFMQRYDHPFLVSHFEESIAQAVSVTPTARVHRDSLATLTPRAQCYSIPLLADRKMPVRIGRSAACDVHTDLATLSGFHAFVGRKEIMEPGTDDRYAAKKYQIRDCGSTNGTYLNGDRIEPDVNMDLKSGDIIRLGDRLKLQFVRGEALIKFLTQYHPLF